jgi:hypothetical protein
MLGRLLVLVLVCSVGGVARPAHGQETPAAAEPSYWAWRASHAERALRSAAAFVAERAQVFPCRPEELAEGAQAAERIPFETLVAEALAARPPRELLFSHGEYLLAIEQVRLGADARAATTPGSARAERAAAQLCEGALALADRRLPSSQQPPAASPPAASLPPPAPPGPALARAAREGVELAVLDARRPYLPPEGAPADPRLEYLLVRFRLQNQSSRPLPYFPLADFELQLPGADRLQPLALGSGERHEAGELGPGDGLIANVTFLVPREARQLVLRLVPSSGPALEVALP